MSAAPLFPANLVLADRPCLVVGGGEVAARKIRSLLASGASVTVVAPDAVPEIGESADVRWHQRPYQRGEAASYRLVITATDDPDVNAQVYRDADAAGVFVNSADDPQNCTFTLPAIARQGDIQVAVSTSGRSPALASWLRECIASDLGPEHEALLDLLADVRAEARSEFGTSESQGWRDALSDGVLDLVRAGEIGAARDRLRQSLGLREAS